MLCSCVLNSGKNVWFKKKQEKKQRGKKKEVIWCFITERSNYDLFWKSKEVTLFSCLFLLLKRTEYCFQLFVIQNSIPLKNVLGILARHRLVATKKFSHLYLHDFISPFCGIIAGSVQFSPLTLTGSLGGHKGWFSRDPLLVFSTWSDTASLFSSVQSFDQLGHLEDIRDDSAEILF